MCCETTVLVWRVMRMPWGKGSANLHDFSQTTTTTTHTSFSWLSKEEL